MICNHLRGLQGRLDMGLKDRPEHLWNHPLATSTTDHGLPVPLEFDNLRRCPAATHSVVDPLVVRPLPQPKARLALLPIQP